MISPRFIGSTLIVAGTALGAGMLAIPMVLAPLGLAMGLGLLLFTWAFTTFAALLLLEVNINHHPGDNMHAMSGHWLGKGGQILADIGMIFLLGFLLMAYILGAGDLLQTALAFIGLDVNADISRTLFTLLASIAIILGTGMVDRFNRLFFITMLATFAIALYAMFTANSSTPTVPQTAETASSQFDIIMAALPVLFTSFGFMVVIPPLVSYTHGTGQQFSKVIVIGSLIPLVCYSLWFVACMNTVEAHELAAFSGVKELVAALGGESDWLNSVLQWFAAMALLTSFLGVALSLYGFFEEVCERNNIKKSRLPAIALTLLPPLLMASSAPGQFLQALSYAGLALTVLAIFIPVAMVWRCRQDPKHDFTIPGGNISLIASMLFGVLLVVAQF